MNVNLFYCIFRRELCAIEWRSVFFKFFVNNVGVEVPHFIYETECFKNNQKNIFMSHKFITINMVSFLKRLA